MDKKKQVLDSPMNLEVTPRLLELKALGDALVCIGLAGKMASLLDGTLQNLGFLIIDLVNKVGLTLEVMEA